MIVQRIIIVGLGLMGGSLARALSGSVQRLEGVDPDPATRVLAVEQGVVAAAAADLSEVNIEADDLLILAMPVRAIVETLARLPLLAPRGCLVLDLGSTKQVICRAMGELPGWFQTVGGHPMCGRESSGFGASSATLFHEQTFVLTPTVHTTPYLQEIALDLIATIGARPLILPPERHDHVAAQVSHLPYLLSALLMQHAARMAESETQFWPVSSSGFRDMARLSGSDPRMMGDILLTNRDMVLAELNAYQRLLADMTAWLEAADAAAIHAWISARQAEHKTYRQRKEDQR